MRILDRTFRSVAKGCITLLTLHMALVPNLCRGHNRPVHEQISVAAALSSQGLTMFLQDDLGPQSNTDSFVISPKLALTMTITLPEGDVLRQEGGRIDSSGYGPVEWVKWGGIYEDRKPNIRGSDHFYDPLTRAGLSDNSEPWYNFLGLPSPIVDSFTWTTVADLREPTVSGMGELNEMRWQNARNYQYAALTAPAKADRDANLALMLYALGHTIHLNQDLSEPEHVRNDNHADKHAIEDYGEKTYAARAIANRPAGELRRLFPLRPRGWGWWRANGFQKLEDFWNRGLYTGQSAALVADAQSRPGAKLGLAEFCNGNFLGEDAVYREYFTNGAPHYFPYPRLSGTTFPDVHKNLLKGVSVVPVKDGTFANRVYLDKTAAQGVAVANHSVLTYEGVKASATQVKISSSIHDDAVLWSYHTNLIPKAIEYNAGILDYFFRGTMSAGLNLDTNIGPYTVTNLNTSGQDFYGGAFYLFQETNGIRSLIQSNDWSGNTLSNGSSMTMTFPGPLPQGAKIFSVYQGTIGVTNGHQALDPVDTNICIAASRAWIEQTLTYTYQIPVPDPYYVETITTNLESDDFGFPITSGNYEVVVNYARFDDTGTIGSLTCHMSPEPSCTLPDEIANAIVPIGDITITPDGRRLSVPVTATDDPICRMDVGWWTITITWRAWPAQ